MGIYDQLSQLDKNIPPPAQPATAETTLNPEPESVQSTQTAVSQNKSQKAGKPENKNARMPENQKARKRANKKTGKPESQKTRLPENKKASLPENQPKPGANDLQVYLDLRASHKVSFRYPDDLIAWLEEALYKLKKRYGQKVTKNALLVAALVYALQDLEENEQQSFLFQQLIQETE